MVQSKSTNNNLKSFIEFQKAFYTDIKKFSNYTNMEFKKHGFVLLTNMGKGLPNLSNIILNIYGFNFNGFSSPMILQALQKTKFCVNTRRNIYQPQFIYFKAPTIKNKKSEKIIKNNKLYIEINTDIQYEIQSILKMDSKDFHLLKSSDKIQNLAKQLMEEKIL